MNSLTLKRHIFSKLKYKKVAHSFAPRPLILTLQQEVLKPNNICVS